MKQALDAIAPIKAVPGNLATNPNREGWSDRLCEALMHMVSHLLNVRIEEIDAETELSEYGFDSITFKVFANQLNQTYQLDLTSSLFFEHSTIERLARYLQTTYAAILTPHFAAPSPVVVKTQVAPEPMITDKVPPVETSQRCTRMVREAVPGNRISFLKAVQGSQED